MALRELIQGVRIWFEGLTDAEKSKVKITYAGHDSEAVKQAINEQNNFCKLDLKGFITVEELKQIHENSIANLYIKIYTTFHHKTIELLSAGRPVICYPSEIDEAIRIANNVKYGLAGYVWTQNLSKALRVTEKMNAGMIWVNSENIRHLPTPFGGTKDSGIGRDGGDWSFDFYMETKNVCLPTIDKKIKSLTK